MKIQLDVKSENNIFSDVHAYIFLLSTLCLQKLQVGGCNVTKHAPNTMCT